MAVQKNGLRKEKDDGKHNSVPYDRADGGVRRNQGDVMELSEIILRAMIEALRIDGKKADVETK